MLNLAYYPPLLNGLALEKRGFGRLAPPFVMLYKNTAGSGSPAKRKRRFTGRKNRKKLFPSAWYGILFFCVDALNSNILIQK